MTGFIRPEVRALLWKFREALAGSVLVLLGIWFVFGPGQLMGLLGYALVFIGVLLVGLGWQRTRFRQATSGLGMVDVDEGQVTYFGPLTGGAMALRDVVELGLIRSRQTPHWRLVGGGEELFIPVDADGSDALFDAFTALPGLQTERMLAALNGVGSQDFVIWTLAPMAQDAPRLH